MRACVRVSVLFCLLYAMNSISVVLRTEKSIVYRLHYVRIMCFLLKVLK